MLRTVTDLSDTTKLVNTIVDKMSQIIYLLWSEQQKEYNSSLLTTPQVSEHHPYSGANTAGVVHLFLLCRFVGDRTARSEQQILKKTDIFRG